jgi:pimeloyl-ACP methyl ester carboxylesterase
MDFDPEPILRHIRCPVLLFYGEDDEWQPVEESITVWRRATERAGNGDVTIVRLPGTGHEPTLRENDGVLVSPLYSQTLVSWLDRRISSLETARQ